VEPKVLSPAVGEQRIAASIREHAIQVILEINDLDRVATLLGAHRFGVEKILRRNPWDIQTALRVAEALELNSLNALEEAAASYAGHSNGNGHGG
jgi:hypothetical protein